MEEAAIRNALAKIAEGISNISRALSELTTSLGAQPLEKAQRSVPKTYIARISEGERKAVENFVTARLRSAPGERLQSSLMHDAFCEWSSLGRQPSLSGKRLAQIMKAKGFRLIHSNVQWWMDVVLAPSFRSVAIAEDGTERDRVTPNMVVLGDPPVGRSALDRLKSSS